MMMMIIITTIIIITIIIIITQLGFSPASSDSSHLSRKRFTRARVTR